MDKVKMKTQILELYLEGLSQKEILKAIKSNNNTKQRKKINRLIKESEYISPKNFRLGAIFTFLITLLVPPISAYLKGPTYNNILPSLISLSIMFSFPFIVLGISFFQTKNLKKIRNIALVFLIYLFIYILFFIYVAYQIELWTIFAFPLLLLPTFIEEYRKMNVLIGKIELIRKNTKVS